MLEIEKKFLLNKFPNIKFDKKYILEQVYTNINILNNYNIPIPNNIKFNHNKNIRLRIKNNSPLIEINQKSGKGIIKDEYQFFIENSNLFEYIKNVNNRIIKLRFEKGYKDFTIFVDKFLNQYNGIIFAEIEYTNKSKIDLQIPDFINIEITYKQIFTNHNMFNSNPKIIIDEYRRLIYDNKNKKS